MAERCSYYYEHKCPVCGSTFIPYTLKWAWRIGSRTFCRYNCMRTWERESKAKNKSISGRNIAPWKRSLDAAQAEHDRLMEKGREEREKGEAYERGDKRRARHFERAQDYFIHAKEVQLWAESQREIKKMMEERT